MKNKNWKIVSIVGVVLLLFLFTIPDVQAQCPMCKIAAESNLKDGGGAGSGLNAGILYMLATPYLIVGLIGFMWWRNRKKSNEDQVLPE